MIRQKFVTGTYVNTKGETVGFEFMTHASFEFVNSWVVNKLRSDGRRRFNGLSSLFISEV